MRTTVFPLWQAAIIAVCLGGCVANDATGIVAADNEQVTNRGAGKDRWWDALPRASWAELRRIEQSQPWFEVYEAAPGVYAIYEPGQFEEVISYLVTGSDAALLFDTGLGIGAIDTLVAELTDLPVTVLNSHTHYDHIGGNHAFSDVLAVDLPWTLARSAGLDHDAVAHAVGPGWIWKALPPGFEPDSYRIRAFGIRDFVHDGQRIDLGGRTLEVLLTPGHAPDALCLIDRRNRLLFTGDTFYPAPLYTHLEGADFAAYAATSRRLAALVDEVDVLLPGHNETALGAAYLQALADAFASVSSGTADYILTDGNRQYFFDGFSIVTRDGPHNATQQ